MMPERAGRVNRAGSGRSAGRARSSIRFGREAVVLARELVDRRGVGFLELEYPAPRGGHDRAGKWLLPAPRADDELVPTAHASRVLSPNELLELRDTFGVDQFRVVPDD